MLEGSALRHIETVLCLHKAQGRAASMSALALPLQAMLAASHFLPPALPLQMDVLTVDDRFWSLPVQEIQPSGESGGTVTFGAYMRDVFLDQVCESSSCCSVVDCMRLCHPTAL